jgi:hypothetical protein
MPRALQGVAGLLWKLPGVRTAKVSRTRLSGSDIVRILSRYRSDMVLHLRLQRSESAPAPRPVKTAPLLSSMQLTGDLVPAESKLVHVLPSSVASFCALGSAQTPDALAWQTRHCQWRGRSERAGGRQRRQELCTILCSACQALVAVPHAAMTTREGEAIPGRHPHRPAGSCWTVGEIVQPPDRSCSQAVLQTQQQASLGCNDRKLSRGNYCFTKPDAPVQV